MVVEKAVVQIGAYSESKLIVSCVIPCWKTCIFVIKLIPAATISDLIFVV